MFRRRMQHGSSFNPTHTILMGILASLALCEAGRAQCAFDWLPGEGHPGVTGDLPVWALTTWDPDGAGPQPAVLVAGGGFHGAGDVATFGVALWDGADWHALDGSGGMGGQVFALTVYNGDLIVGGTFLTAGGVSVSHVARWDGATWHPLGNGVNNTVRALAVYEGELYAGGFFTQADGLPASGIARWNGTIWQPVGTGLGGVVFALTNFQGDLIAAGGLNGAAARVGRWNGAAWQSMDGAGPEIMQAPNALGVFDDELIVGAMFFSTGGQFVRSVARWNGTAWASIGDGGNHTPNDIVFAIIEFNKELYVGGVFSSVTGGVSTPNRVARWNGSAWSALPSGPGIPARRMQSFAIYNGSLIAGGLSTKPNGLQTSEVGRWDGVRWNYMGGGVNSVVDAVASYQGDLYISGFFTQAGDIPVHGIARRSANGEWDCVLGGLTGGFGFANSMVVYEDALIVAGSFTAAGGVPADGIASWNGKAWQPFGDVHAGNLFAHEGELYGTIPSVIPNASQVGRWNPAAQQWQALGTLPSNVVILCLTVYNGDLIAAGFGGVGAPGSIFRFDGTTWHPIGGPFGFTTIETLIVYNGELIAGGVYDHSLGGPQDGIIRWAGTSWVPLGGGLFEEDSEHNGVAVWDMKVFNGELFVAGQFSHAGTPFGTPAHNIARWNGLAWAGLGAGASDDVRAVVPHGGGLAFGGWFILAGGSPNGHVALWASTCLTGDMNCDGIVSPGDIAGFVLALTNPSEYASQFPNCSALNGDINGDGLVTPGDIAGFVSLLISG